MAARGGIEVPIANTSQSSPHRQCCLIIKISARTIASDNTTMSVKSLYLEQTKYAEYDVIVVGSGNAGFSAALSARENGAKKVLLVDKCPPEWAGGNTYFTAGAYRTVFHGLEDLLSFVQPVDKEIASKIDMKPYTKEDFRSDLMRVTNGRADPDLGRVLVEESRETIRWLAGKGIKFQLSFNRYPSLVESRTYNQTSVSSRRTMEILGRNGPLNSRWRKRSRGPTHSRSPQILH